MGLKWGGRGAGGRATNRCSVQPYDVVVEGCTMAYLGSTLLDRTTLRLLQGRKYGLIGRNGVGKRSIVFAAYNVVLMLFVEAPS
jgi:ABC-type transport system involved in cytochrome bd biosynthesis fused ATPase/permease subunit